MAAAAGLAALAGATLLFVQVVLAAPPTTNFTISPTVAQLNQDVTFTAPDGTASANWTFGDGGAATGVPSVKHQYSSPGTVTVTMNGTDSGGTAFQQTAMLKVNAPPTADFVPSSLDPNPGDIVSFDSSGSGDTDGTIASYAWTFGDGSTSAAASPKHVYTTAGDKTVTLRVTDSDGAQATKVATVHVNAPPTAAFTFTPTHPNPGQSVSFDASGSSDPDPGDSLTYSWDFGDGTHGSGVSPSHTYAGLGDRTVTLTVTDSGGLPATASHPLHVNEPPTAGIVNLPPYPRTGEDVTFVASFSDPDGSVTGFGWDFAGGTGYNDSHQQTAHHTFDSPGVKTVNLRIEDNDGQPAFATVKVLVQDTVPKVAFDFTPTSPVPGQQITFKSSSAASAGKSILYQHWELDGDGKYDDASGSQATWKFTTPGPKTVGLEVREANGGVARLIKTVSVNSPPHASFDQSPSTLETGDRGTFSSTSTDADGPLVSQQWDLNNDGRFDDASGAVASRRFALPGTYTVRLRVLDARGAASVAVRKVRVAHAYLPDLHWSILGHTTSRSTRITRWYVKAQRGAMVTVRCRGRGCPHTQRKRAGRLRLRFRKLERLFRPGTRISVSETRRGYIGRYVLFKIGRSSFPQGKRLCLKEGARRPSRCGPRASSDED